MNSKDKIQHMLITHLLKEGKISLTLPDGIQLDVGITQEGRNGYEQKCENYCWVTASQGDREAFIDSYGLEMKYSNGFVVQDESATEEGELVKFVDVI